MTQDGGIDALVVGAGPAGLMAAEELARAGRRVLVAEQKPSVARKFLMAGKSGLNLTQDEPSGAFASHYDSSEMRRAVASFGPAEVMDWARGLGQEVYTGSSGKVFPLTMKGSPLLRAWLSRLADRGVALRTRWRWHGWDDGAFAFDTPDGPRALRPAVCVLALGGASWARLGSDGAWAPWLAGRGVPLTPFAPANAGLSVAWSRPMAKVFGQPLKGVRLGAGALHSRGECVVSAAGLEGGGLYPLTPALRTGAPLQVDLLPDLDTDTIAARLRRPRGKASVGQWLRKTLRLDPVRLALLFEAAHPLPTGEALAHRVKALTLRHQGPRPMDEAISTAGGIAWPGLDDDLMLRACPGVFAAGEMLDWEAPTGGYLLTGCLATGRLAGRAAAGFH
ncbi:hypothetical protein SAMN04490244_10957 [Tranquillimonas rosea]|uniref:TIGR03862 family flavoprotein n=1 Tax=Tranquillimonas rosea TaxID=641238 RepID=A0A1H9W3X6_9RHOB|nr:TIGR03862 family flavoprotein [Tranquillimonas rosea]SES28387.1 hypothetical protein SAMN04490244_10957 [Tranquillimonas rosea]